jgi:hypothetical protein
MSSWSLSVTRTLFVIIKRVKFFFFSFLIIADHFRSIVFRSIIFQNFVSTIANDTHFSCRSWNSIISRRSIRWFDEHSTLFASSQSLARYFNRFNCLDFDFWRSRCFCDLCDFSRFCNFSRFCDFSRSRRSRWFRCFRCCSRCSLDVCSQRSHF